ncbi:hypothetical protein GCM10017044_13820 [Kordiimonas sediminis]|uniref:DUF1013 domain-containing protein n=1 Tax=Kordiimonas sediminis TaxID=1735581 RepID=A0A919APP0_9PROT|nr:cell cycle transcriptional regulator TrcR [Kordiimonas sediminis]GHF20248.1 hypothetical protein GCM10017044_13820 [Kordiimonas sediminis]
MTQPLMPMATAVWLVDNTTLTFDQIAEFCGLHKLEVQGVADGTVGAHIVGLDPTTNAQLTWDEIKRCQDDSTASLKLLEDEVKAMPRTKGPRYTPVSKRQDKPDAIAWLVRNHPELSDLQISRLVGTTKPTIQAIRGKTHWNSSNIKPQDPVGLGLCKQLELDAAVKLASARKEKMLAKGDAPADGAADASEADVTVAEAPAAEDDTLATDT